MIKLANISKTYKTKKKKETKALNGVSLELPNKGLVFILGKSGSGKSTLLNIIGCLDTFDEGNMFVDNQSIKDFSQKQLDDYRNTFIGFIFQEFNLLEEFNVKQNIALASKLQGNEISDVEIEKLLSDLDLVDIQDKYPNELSGGQKQRVAIAGAIAKNLNLYSLMNQLVL